MHGFLLCSASLNLPGQSGVAFLKRVQTHDSGYLRVSCKILKERLCKPKIFDVRVLGTVFRQHEVREYVHRALADYFVHVCFHRSCDALSTQSISAPLFNVATSRQVKSEPFTTIPAALTMIISRRRRGGYEQALHIVGLHSCAVRRYVVSELSSKGNIDKTC
jgi:hypothetical protein